jgi:ABC-type sugar transport system substrate-binding protein
MVRKTASGYVVISVAALTLAACGSGGAASSGGAGSGGGSGGGASGAAIGMSLSTLNNPFFVEVRDGAQAEAKKLGVKLTVQDSQNDASQQANHVQNFITQQDKAIIVNPVDSDAIVPSVKAANNAKIPVIAVDRGASGGTLVTTVASDNVQGGRDAADQIATLVGSGPIVVLQGIPGTSAERDRSSGFTEQIAKHPNIKVVATQPADFDRTKGLDVMQNLLQAHPDLKGVFAENDEMALGAIKALGSKAGTAVKVVGFDGTPDGLNAVKAGQENADIAQQPSLLGELAVQNAVNQLNGKTVENPVKVPVKVVTKDNVDQFMASKPTP